MTALRLVCLPPAGSSVAVFRGWGPQLAPHVDVDAHDLPGRGGGAVPEEGPSFTEAAERYAALLTEQLDPTRPWALWGHSTGGLLAFEIARRMCVPERPWPQFVVVAGSRPPHRSLSSIFSPMLGWDDEMLLDGLASVGAVNPALRSSPLRRLFLPALRRDLRLLCSYSSPERRYRLPVDVIAWHGSDDPLAPASVGREWADHTSARFVERTFVGGHFFPMERADEVMPAIAALHRPGPTPVVPARPAPRCRHRPDGMSAASA